MIRTHRAGVAAILAAALLALAPAGAAGAAVTGEAASTLVAANADVDDFVFERLEVSYELGRDAEGRSTLRTVEHFIALFPDHDQNRGIRRALPKDYDGHSTDIRILAVTDERGNARDYVTDSEDEFLNVTIAVPPSQYVHGEQHYVIEYEQRDVTKYFRDTDDDEFYWDVNGTAWAQPFGEVAAELRLSPELASLVTETACYQGPEGSTDHCDIVQEGDTVSIAVADLGPGENATLVVAFPPQTFAAVPFGRYDWVPGLPVGAVVATLAALAVGIVTRLTSLRDARGRGLVIARYAPPPGVSILLAAEVLGRRTKAVPATMVDLAVRRRLRIIESDGRWHGKRFGLQRVDADARPGLRPEGPELLPEEQRILDALFLPDAAASSLRALLGSAGAVDEQGIRWLDTQDQALAKRIAHEHKTVRTQALAGGLRRKPSLAPAALVILLSAIGLLLWVLTATLSLHESGTIAGVIGAIAAGWIGLFLGILLGTRRPLTPAGAELKEELLGLREFIGWAEADRLRMLQSVDGAERVALEGGAPRPDDRALVVRVYERLLPYAIVFGQEKQWAAALSTYYDDRSPDWYAGASVAFSITSFSSSISSFSSTAAASSSSGGSGGGGSSGGGGGGGGGGGV